MARHFTAANIANGYAAMGGSLRRPRYAGASLNRRSVQAAIDAERVKAARMARASKKK